ncbi:MAG: DUF1003 domain-containing protein [Candidatus Peregrinibacteria bacterium]
MSLYKKHLHNDPELHQQLVSARREKIKSFKAKMDLQRGISDKIADFLTEAFGTVFFLSVNATWFFIWIAINTGFVPGIPVFDPFPFGLLTMIVSLEAIFLAIIVLISQNRSGHILDIREEIDLQINVRTEEEVTKILIILDKIREHLGVSPEDDSEMELVVMKQKTDLIAIEQGITEEMSTTFEKWHFSQKTEEQ